MKRRDWILATFGGLGALAGGVVHACAQAPDDDGGERPVGDGALPLGVQLYTVRALMAGDVPGTLGAVAAIGYREVELAGLHGLAPADMRARLDEAGLAAPSGHVALEELRSAPARVLDVAAVLGQRWVVVPWVAPAERTPDGYRRVADDLNAAGERARQVGLKVAYHNHDFEMASLAGAPDSPADPTDARPGRAWDLLLERTDPALVAMQMDVYWTVHGGADPLAYLRAWPGRFTSVHAKGRTADGRMVAVGEGTIDYAAVLFEARSHGLEHVFVEHDQPADPLASIRTSYDTLAALEV